MSANDASIKTFCIKLMIKATVTAATTATTQTTQTTTATAITTTAKFNVTLISQKVCHKKADEDTTIKF